MSFKTHSIPDSYEFSFQEKKRRKVLGNNHDKMPKLLKHYK